MRVRYDDRRQAGQRLAEDLSEFADDPAVIIVGLPRGGVPVAFEIAQALRAPLEVLAVHKIGSPWNPEFAIGAVAEDGTVVIDQKHAHASGLAGAELSARIEQELKRLTTSARAFGRGSDPLVLTGRKVLLVDDGLATGLTDLTAIRSVRKQRPSWIVLAIPIAAAASLPRIAAAADQVVCPCVVEDLVSVGSWYRNFSQVTDDQVLQLLQRA